MSLDEPSRKWSEDFLPFRMKASDLPDMALRNCHTTGVDSIVLSYTPSEVIKMTRLFVAHTGKHRLNSLRELGGNYIVAPHNHRYPLWITPIVGSFVNVNYNQSPQGFGLDRYKFRSGVNGVMSTERICHSRWRETFTYVPNFSTIHLDSDQFHTVLLPTVTSPFTCWIVQEGQDERGSEILTPGPIIPDENLYQPMPLEDAWDLLSKVQLLVPLDFDKNRM